jgi:hypothetical protein
VFFLNVSACLLNQIPVSDNESFHGSHQYEWHETVSVGGDISIIAPYGLKAESCSDPFWNHNQHVCLISIDLNIFSGGTIENLVCTRVYFFTIWTVVDVIYILTCSQILCIDICLGLGVAHVRLFMSPTNYCIIN